MTNTDSPRQQDTTKRPNTQGEPDEQGTIEAFKEAHRRPSAFKLNIAFLLNRHADPNRPTTKCHSTFPGTAGTRCGAYRTRYMKVRESAKPRIVRMEWDTTETGAAATQYHMLMPTMEINETQLTLVAITLYQPGGVGHYATDVLMPWAERSTEPPGRPTQPTWFRYDGMKNGGEPSRLMGGVDQGEAPPHFEVAALLYANIHQRERADQWDEGNRARGDEQECPPVYCHQKDAAESGTAEEDTGETNKRKRVGSKVAEAPESGQGLHDTTRDEIDDILRHLSHMRAEREERKWTASDGEDRDRLQRRMGDLSRKLRANNNRRRNK